MTSNSSLTSFTMPFIVFVYEIALKSNIFSTFYFLQVPEKPSLKCIGFSYNGAKLYNMLARNIKETFKSSSFKKMIKGWIWTNIPSY